MERYGSRRRGTAVSQLRPEDPRRSGSGHSARHLRGSVEGEEALTAGAYPAVRRSAGERMVERGLCARAPDEAGPPGQ